VLFGAWLLLGQFAGFYPIALYFKRKNVFLEHSILKAKA
jgi:hypothetical protein